jgi:undecaprenyl-diphosphatase
VNDYGLSAILGIVEGLTEFLPVSSTAHLRIAEALLHIPLDSGYWKMYTIVIQLGAILTLPIYFRHRIAKFLSTFPQGERGDRTVLTHPLSLVVIAFVVTAIPSFLLVKKIGEHLESLYIMGTAMILGGVIMWLVDAFNSRWEKAGPDVPGTRIRTWHMEDMTLGQAVWIGFCQIFSAVFPGTSRSMSTITGGQIVGMSRASALEFSFFLSMPTMAVATIYDLLKSVFGHGENAVGINGIDAHGWIVLAIGFIVSFLVAYAAVAWFLAWVRKHGFIPFAIYRILAGAILLAWVVNHAG